ncbi:hypothetical protein, partial [Methylophaga sp. UBA3996]|uniref:hypothetical protein n=1 Tax=Methylophaga sp. UBA3996 TaxID=1946891 RepID=UPI0025A0030E
PSLKVTSRRPYVGMTDSVMACTPCPDGIKKNGFLRPINEKWQFQMKLPFIKNRVFYNVIE